MRPEIFDVSWPTMIWRVLWIVLRLALVVGLAQRGVHFFYQGF